MASGIAAEEGSIEADAAFVGVNLVVQGKGKAGSTFVDLAVVGMKRSFFGVETVHIEDLASPPLSAGMEAEENIGMVEGLRLAAETEGKRDQDARTFAVVVEGLEIENSVGGEPVGGQRCSSLLLPYLVVESQTQ